MQCNEERIHKEGLGATPDTSPHNRLLHPLPDVTLDVIIPSETNETQYEPGAERSDFVRSLADRLPNVALAYRETSMRLLFLMGIEVEGDLQGITLHTLSQGCHQYGFSHRDLQMVRRFLKKLDHRHFQQLNTSCEASLALLIPSSTDTHFTLMSPTVSQPAVLSPTTAQRHEDIRAELALYGLKNQAPTSSRCIK
jgi:hypothetical protein